MTIYVRTSNIDLCHMIMNRIMNRISHHMKI